MRPTFLRAPGATSTALLVALALAASTAGAQQRDSTSRRPLPVADSVRADSARRAAARADSTAAAPTRRTQRPRRASTGSAIPDSLLRPPISSRRAFLYSLAIPGQGQKSLRRPRAAAFFGSIEVGSIFMLLKSENDLRIARAHVADSVFTGSYTPSTTGNPADSTPAFRQDRLSYRVRARQLHVQDWVAAIVFNHLISGADAFVAAQLWDLPAQVSFRPAPRGLAVSASVTW